MPSVDAFFDPEPRLELMKDMGIDRALMWPTLASVVEERLADDPDAACAVVHALNEWMHEHWTYNYSDAIFATPDHLPRPDGQGDRGAAAGRRARCACVPVASRAGAHVHGPQVVRAARSSTRSGSSSPSSTSWSACTRATAATSATSTTGKASATASSGAFVGNGAPGFLTLMSEKSNLVDAMASIIGHGVATPLPDA